MLKKLGPYAFIAGAALSALAGALLPFNGTISLVVMCLGVIVGLLNIADKEVMGFLLAAIALTVSAGALGTVFAQLPLLATAAPAFFGYIVAFAGPAAGVVALKQIIMLAKD